MLPMKVVVDMMFIERNSLREKLIEEQRLNFYMPSAGVVVEMLTHLVQQLSDVNIVVVGHLIAAAARCDG